MKTAVVDLFCGVGGLTHGLISAGLDVVAGVDSDASCRFAYEANNKARFIEADVAEYGASEVNRLYEDADIKILVGCAPCQTFSAQVNKYRKMKDMRADTRWTMLNHFADYIKEIRPVIVSMENVPSLAGYEIFAQFKENLADLGYHISAKIVDCAEYGLPQRRRRLVLLASGIGDIKLIEPEQYSGKKRTVRDAIGGLPPIDNGKAHDSDSLHRSGVLTPLNLKRIKQSKPGGTWEDWDENLILACHKKDSGKCFKNVYGRMQWDKPAPTITTQFCSISRGRFGHPQQDRAISLREAALLQTFPPEYKFSADIESINPTSISRHIGNAVPVDLGHIIGISIKKHLEETGNWQRKQNSLN